MNNLLPRLDAHIRQMAPHVAVRDTGQLLVESRTDIASLTARVAELEQATKWCDAKRPPVVQEGAMKKFLITYETRQGKRGVKTAWFANAHWVEWSDEVSPDEDEVDEEGGKRWTGWLEERSTYHGGDYIMDVEETVIAWMPQPLPAEGAQG